MTLEPASKDRCNYIESDDSYSQWRCNNKLPCSKHDAPRSLADNPGYQALKAQWHEAHLKEQRELKDNIIGEVNGTVTTSKLKVIYEILRHDRIKIT